MELDYEIAVPALDNGKAASCFNIRIHLSSVDEFADSYCWKFSIITWQTYCEAFDSDISHYLYDISLTSDNDLITVIERVKSIILACS